MKEHKDSQNPKPVDPLRKALEVKCEKAIAKARHSCDCGRAGSANEAQMGSLEGEPHMMPLFQNQNNFALTALHLDAVQREQLELMAHHFNRPLPAPAVPQIPPTIMGQKPPAPNPGRPGFF